MAVAYFVLVNLLDSPEHACYQGFSALIELETKVWISFLESKRVRK